MNSVIVKDEVRDEIWNSAMCIAENNPRLNKPIRRLVSCIQNPMEIGEGVLKQYMGEVAACFINHSDMMCTMDRKDLLNLVNRMLKEFGQSCELRFASPNPDLKAPRLYGEFIGVEYSGTELKQFLYN